MQRKKLWLCLICVIFSGQALGSDFQFIGNIENYTQKRNVVEIQCNNANAQIIILTDDLVRIRMTREKEFPPDFSYSVLPISKSVSMFKKANIASRHTKCRAKESNLVLRLKKDLGNSHRRIGLIC